jgi:hypothetical protein
MTKSVILETWAMKISDLSTTSRLNKFTGGLNLMQTDYNNDGLKDIFVLRGAAKSGGLASNQIHLKK